MNGPQVIPPAYGLAGIDRITVHRRRRRIAYWNRYVAVTQMGGHGTFMEPRTGVNVTNGTDDLVTQAARAAGVPAELRRAAAAGRSFDAAAAARGKAVFEGAGRARPATAARVHRRERPLHAPGES